MNSLYLIINLGCILIPFIFSFHPKIQFHKEWKYFFKANALIALLFIIWDIIFTKIGIWGFNPNYLIGWYVYNLPIEEILFFICIPYACLFTYHAIKKLIPLQNHFLINTLAFILALILIIIALYNHHNWYTLSALFTSGGFIIFLLYQNIQLRYYFLCFMLIIPFFLMSNGILTGTFIDEPIVWYNHQENLNIQIFTIPIEDTFYGMLLIFGNIYLFENFKNKSNVRTC